MNTRGPSGRQDDTSTAADDHCRVCGTGLYLDDVTHPSDPVWLDADGEYATCGDSDPHIPARW